MSIFLLLLRPVPTRGRAERGAERGGRVSSISVMDARLCFSLDGRGSKSSSVQIKRNEINTHTHAVQLKEVQLQLKEVQYCIQFAINFAISVQRSGGTIVTS